MRTTVQQLITAMTADPALLDDLLSLYFER
jgi:hypothetical protein